MNDSGIMSRNNGRNRESLSWTVALHQDRFEVYECPGIEAPEPWIHAFKAVTSDLQCLRYGRSINVDKVIWNFSIDSEYLITLGWEGSESFRVTNAWTLESSFEDVAVWVADAVQTNLSGYEFVQWPSRGGHILTPAIRNNAAVWIDPQTKKVISPIGELCKKGPSWSN